MNTKIKKTLPGIKFEKINRSELSKILLEAMSSYWNFLKQKKISVPNFDRTIYGAYELETKNHIPLLRLEVPQYERIVHNKELEPPHDNEKIEAFYDYMWEKGAFNITLVGPDPDKESWKPWVFNKYIKHPLLYTLYDDAIEEATSTGKISPWNILDPQFTSIIEKITDQIIGQATTYKAICPLRYLNVKNEKQKKIKISNSIFLRILSDSDLLKYLSKHRQKFDFIDVNNTIFNDHLIFIEVYGAITEKNLTKPHKIGNKTVNVTSIIENEISDNIDLLKWAIMATSNNINSLQEGLIIYDDTIGNRLSHTYYGFYRRQNRSNGGQIYEFNKINLEAVVEIIKKAQMALKRLPDLKQAFWYWGRSYIARSERDMILDSVIGLETLLVPSAEGGGIKFRFSLFGTALLAKNDDEAKDINKDLKDIYSERGIVAHGNREKAVKMANLALNYLTIVIKKIIELHDQEIIVQGKKIAKQIENNLIKKGYLCIDQK